MKKNPNFADCEEECTHTRVSSSYAYMVLIEYHRVQCTYM